MVRIHATVCSQDDDPEQWLRSIFRNYNARAGSLETLQQAFDTAQQQHELQDTQIYKNVQRFLENIEKGKELHLSGATYKDSISFNIWDYGGQKVFSDMYRINLKPNPRRDPNGPFPVCYTLTITTIP